MTKAIAALIILTSVVPAYILMVKGWGLEVKSWPWLIGCVVVGILLTIISSSLKNEE